MITGTPTEHLTGVLLEGEYQDFYEMVESIYRITGLDEDPNSPYWSVKQRLLGICFDIRHAYQGDRTVKTADNGVHKEMMKWHSVVLPQENVHFAVEVLFPEAVFVALALPEMYADSRRYYGKRAEKRLKNENNETKRIEKYSDYVRDRAMMDMLAAAVFSALAEVIGEEELEKLLDMRSRNYDNEYRDFATQYVDKCNADYLKAAQEKRKDKLKGIAKRLVKLPDAYYKMKAELMYWAREEGWNIHEMYDPGLEYPDEVEW